MVLLSNFHGKIHLLSVKSLHLAAVWADLQCTVLFCMCIMYSIEFFRIIFCGVGVQCVCCKGLNLALPPVAIYLNRFCFTYKYIVGLLSSVTLEKKNCYKLVRLALYVSKKIWYCKSCSRKSSSSTYAATFFWQWCSTNWRFFSVMHLVTSLTSLRIPINKFVILLFLGQLWRHLFGDVVYSSVEKSPQYVLP